MVDFNEYGATQFDGEGRLIPYVDCGGASADIVIALKDGDVDGKRGFGGILREVECRRGTAGASACDLTLVKKDWSRDGCLPMIATLLVGGVVLLERAVASGNKGAMPTIRTIL